MFISVLLHQVLYIYEKYIINVTYAQFVACCIFRNFSRHYGKKRYFDHNFNVNAGPVNIDESSPNFTEMSFMDNRTICEPRQINFLTLKNHLII